MPRLSAQDFYELAPDGEVRRWSRAHWGLEDLGIVEFCDPVEPYRDGCPDFGATPAGYLAQLEFNFVVKAFLDHSAAFQLQAPALAGTLQSLLAETPETSGLAVTLRRSPELAGGIAAIRIDLSRNGAEMARTAIRKPGVTTIGESDPPNLHYEQGLEFADWDFNFSPDAHFRGAAALVAGRPRWQDLLTDRFAGDLLALL